MKTDTRRCICLDCLYGSQPYGYFPIICVHGKRIREMWEEKYRCRHFEPCPEPATADCDDSIGEEPTQQPWQVILTKRH